MNIGYRAGDTLKEVYKLMDSKKILVEVKDVRKHFPIRRGVFLKEVDSVKAVDGVSFEINEGETFGLVGESGCGKTTLGMLLLGLEELSEGQIVFDGNAYSSTNLKKMKELRKDIQVIFQDPYESLNPRMTVGELIGEGLRIQTKLSKSEIKEKVQDILKDVGLAPEHYYRYPHEFSGGQRQRIGIARALIVNPRFIVCDEPVSALDVSVQAQIMNLLNKIQKQYSLTYLFIAHGLNVVKYISDRIGVMYLGKIVEISKSEELFNNPKHPYTEALLNAIPQIDEYEHKQNKILKGDIPSPVRLPNGCRFHTRCEKCMEICKKEEPVLKEVGDGKVACHLYN